MVATWPGGEREAKPALSARFAPRSYILMRFTNKNVSRKAAAITVASALTIFGGAGAALAYWTTTGSGSGSSSVGTDAGVTLSAPATAQLAPGTSDTVDITAHNGSASLL